MLKKYVTDFVGQHFPSASVAENDERVAKLMSVTALEGLRRDLQNSVDQAGVLSFSKVRNHILMWSHYADKHTGLCLEFDGSANCEFFGEAQAVEYDDYRPISLGDDPVTQMGRVILTKSKHWMYEQEYRIFRPGEAYHVLEFPRHLLTGVIFGYRMPTNLRQLVRQWAAEGNCRIAFFEARPKARKFALEISRVD